MAIRRISGHLSTGSFAVSVIPSTQLHAPPFLCCFHMLNFFSEALTLPILSLPFSSVAFSDQRTLVGQKAGSGGIVFISESGDSLVRAAHAPCFTLERPHHPNRWVSRTPFSRRTYPRTKPPATSTGPPRCARAAYHNAPLRSLPPSLFCLTRRCSHSLRCLCSELDIKQCLLSTFLN